jgi:hypothetical protein
MSVLLTVTYHAVLDSLTSGSLTFLKYNGKPLLKSGLNFSDWTFFVVVKMKNHVYTFLGFAVLYLMAVTVSSEHDHTEHVDTGFIIGEARRIAWLEPDQIKRSKLELADELTSYETKYQEWFLEKGADPTIWEK